MTGPITPIAPGSASYGLSWKSVSVMSVDGNLAVVRDQLSQTFKMDRTNMRAKADLPAVGETWIVDRSYGDWSFAMIVHKDSTKPPDLPPVIAVANAAERDALIVYPGMTVYRVDTCDHEVWSGTAWVLQEPVADFCRLTLNIDAALAAGDTLAQANWGITANIGYTINNTTGNAYIDILTTGRYEMDFQPNFDHVAGAQFACKIMRNGTSPTANAIATDTRNSVPGAEGTWLYAHSKTLLFVGDRLYWQVFASAPATLRASKNSIQTRISFRRLGIN